MKKKYKNIIRLLGILVLGAGLIAGLILVKQKQNPAPKAAPSTSIYVVPTSQSKAPGNTFSYSVNMDTAGNAVTGIDIKMDFDPSVFEISSLQFGSSATNLNQIIANTYDNTAGKIQFAIFTLNTSQAVIGSNLEVLKVNGIIKSTATAGNYQLAFDPETKASALLAGENVIISRNPGTITITSSTPSPNPTRTHRPRKTPKPRAN